MASTYSQILKSCPLPSEVTAITWFVYEAFVSFPFHKTNWEWELTLKYKLCCSALITLITTSVSTTS